MLFFKHLTFLSVILIATGCGTGDKSKITEPELIEVETLQPFMDFDRHGIAGPNAIAVMPNGNVVVADVQLLKVTIVDDKGNLIRQFGEEGKGPSEFVQLSQLILNSGKINVVDVSQKKVLEFDYDGNFLDSYIYKSNGVSNNISLIANRIYVAEAGGRENKLLAITDATMDTTLLFGEAKNELNEEVDFQKSRNDVLHGRVPPFLRNMANVKYSNGYVYAFLDSYSELLKFDLEGKLIWQQLIPLPHNELIRQQVADAISKNPNILPFVRYTYAMEIVDDEIYLLAAKAGAEPQHLVVINENGEMKTIYKFSDADYSFISFSVNKPDKMAYLSSTSDGLVYKFNL